MKKWETQNKIAPGIYGKERSEADSSVVVSDRGVVALPCALNWGPEGMQKIRAGENLLKYIGYTILDSEALFIKEIFKNSHTLYLYNTRAGGVKATKTSGGMTVTSKHPGTAGNKIKFVAEKALDDTFDVEVYMGVELVEEKTGITAVTDITSDYVTVTGTLTETAGITLEGGTNGTETNGSFTSFLEAVETLKNINAIGYMGTDNTVKELFVMTTKRIRDNIGNKIACVLPGYPQADHRSIYSVKNGVVIDGRTLTNAECVPFILGAVGGVNVSTSLTYFTYAGASTATGDLTDDQQIEALKNGEILFFNDDDVVRIMQDVTTLKTYTEENPKLYRKGRPSRTVDSYDKDIDSNLKQYIGKVNNNNTDRGIIKTVVFNLAVSYEEQGAYENVVIDDFEVEIGEERDAILVKYAVQPLDSIDKIYLERTVR